MVTNRNILELQNPWWEDASAILRDLHILEIENKSYRYEPPVIDGITFNGGDINIIRGPRQVGKTTTIKLIIKKLLLGGNDPSSIIYLSCESLETFRELQTLLITTIKERKASRLYIFLDEVTFIESWQRAILGLANMGLLKNAAVVLTGSNARDLKKSAERLPGRRGRGGDHKLYPLSILELARLKCFADKNLDEILEMYMRVGGFPRAIADFVTLGGVTDTTYNTYRNWIAGDAQKFELRQETLKQILYRIAETIASQVTWPVLIENSPVRSHETALQYVEHLQEAFLCEIHYCYDEKTKGPAFQKARKIFFIDPLLYAIAITWKEGMPNVFEWMKQKLGDSGFKGKLLESIVVSHAARMFDQTYYWYSSKQRKEIDLLIPHGRGLMLYDVKLGKEEPFRAMGREINILSPKEFLKFLSQANV